MPISIVAYAAALLTGRPVEWTGIIMRIVFALVMVISAVAQTPLVRIVNVSHPANGTFQVGDKYEILLTGAAFQQISVRTTMEGRIDWGPIIGSTDSTGRWSTGGQFAKSHFGSWGQIWTAGGKLASPAIQFQVGAPCLPGGQSFSISTGLHTALTCETAEGSQSFSTLSASDSFRSPDGRLVAGQPAERTQDEYQTGVLQELLIAQRLLTGPVSLHSSRGGRGDETAELISNLIGANALSENEIRNVLAILRRAFERPESIAPGKKSPIRTLMLLQQLSTFVSDTQLQLQIADTLEYVQTR